MIQFVQKRDGTLVNFEQQKITEAIWKAAQSVGGTNRETSEKISNQVSTVLEVFFKEESPAPTVEQIQDLVEKILIENGHAKTAKAYIIYREVHKKLRQKGEELLGVQRLKLTTVDGENSQLGGFIILDIEDDLEAIFEGMKETVIIHQNDEKACVNFSELRPQGDAVKGKQQASGPIAFMKLYDTALSTIKTPELINMPPHVVLLNVSHPNILEFLEYADTNGKLENFTLMVEVTPNFMEAAEQKKEYELINPHNNSVTKKLDAAEIFEKMVDTARKSGNLKPIVIEYPVKQLRKHASIQVNLPFDEKRTEEKVSKVTPSAPKIQERVQKKEERKALHIELPPIQTLA